MKNHKLLLVSGSALLLIILCTITAQAQILPPPPPGPSSVPLDPFSWVVLGVGGAIAGQRYFSFRKKRKND